MKTFALLILVLFLWIVGLLVAAVAAFLHFNGKQAGGFGLGLFLYGFFVLVPSTIALVAHLTGASPPD